ncbi:MAG: RloB family protein [Coriobacteriales bacterium]|jgi:hypothetical protein|nr:RloB family protein [Coriobacteriales bacterium]
MKRPKSYKKSYKRRKAFREPGKRVLVVTEGTVTEPRYFDALLSKLQISTRSVVVYPSNGSDPITIVDTAICTLTRNRENHEPAFDEAWLVFDTEDQREHLSEALDKARAHKLNLAINAPSIEYWFLLHFEYTTKYMVKCREVEHELRKHCTYTKDGFDATLLIAKTDVALSNARRIRNNRAPNTEFPQTDMDLLVTEINALASDANKLFDKLSDKRCE